MLKSETVETAALIPYARNARTHSEEQVQQIAASIKEFGFLNPIIIDGENGIIAGHGRLQAAQLLGLDKVPAVEASHLTDAQKRAYIIADNKLALNAGWDNELLGLEFQDLELDGFDLELTGFGLDEIGALTSLLDANEGLTDPDATPELQDQAITVKGDTWLCGKHRVRCGDSTSADDVAALIDGAAIDLIHTDPPYGMNAVSKSGVLSERYGQDILGDDTPDVAKEAFILAQAEFPAAKQVWWGANYYSSSLPDSECWLVWDKNNGGSDQTDCELAWANFRSVVRQFTMASEKVGRVHPTQKPVELMEWIVKRFHLSAETILDMFAGSGSTLIAAERHAMRGYMMEMDERFVDVIVRRWQEFTGEEATLEGDGRTFNEIEGDRCKAAA